MNIVNIHQAKTHFSKLVDAAMKGEETVIAKAGKPVARICPIIQKKPKRRLGLLKGKIQVAKDFEDPLPEELLADFEK